METLAQTKSFLNLDDAVTWMDWTIWDWQQSGWSLDEGTSLRFVNEHWQVFLEFKKNG